jgi:molybdopterin-guanine dinucleotide biosynthesis protein A
MSQFFDQIRKRMGYMLSLPERTMRSFAALAGGTTSLLSETLFPESLRGTTMYRIFIGDAQKFMIDKVAQVHRETGEIEEPVAPSDDYLQRKVVGGMLETAGLFAMHMSPLWVFAIAGDAAAGSREFLDRLINQLKRNGVVPLDAKIEGLPDLLAAMQETSQKSATAVDTPPLSREEINRLAGEMTESYRKMFSQAGNLVPRIEQIWSRMEQLSSRENISMERLQGILTMDVAGWGRKGVGTAMAFGQTGSELLGEKVLDSYSKTLSEVSTQGVSQYISNHLKPFMEAAAGHFSRDKKTWTETILRFTAKEVKEPTPETGETPPGGMDYTI